MSLGEILADGIAISVDGSGLAEKDYMPAGDQPMPARVSLLFLTGSVSEQQARSYRHTFEENPDITHLRSGWDLSWIIQDIDSNPSVFQYRPSAAPEPTPSTRVE